MPIYLSGDPDTDTLLEKNPFALLVGMVLDQQVPLERAFSAPYALRERLGGKLDAKTVAATDAKELATLFSIKPALHRFPSSMADRVQTLARLIVDEHDGDAAAIWTKAKTGDELLANIRKLPGFGPQKAQIFLALLGKQLGIRPKGWEKAAGPFGKPETFSSVADIDSHEALLRVHDHKRQMKAAAKSADIALQAAPKQGAASKV